MPGVFSIKPDPLELRQRAGRYWWVGAWLPAALAVAVIARESTLLFSAVNTSSWLRPIFERVFGPFEDRHWDHLHMLIRKSGHFVGYGLVCFAFLRAWLLTLGRGANLSAGRWRAQSVGYALAATFLVAGSDEWHQTFLPGRTGQFSDVLLDTVGGAVVCGLVWVRFWRGRSPQS